MHKQINSFFPNISVSGKVPLDFVPIGWKIRDSLSIDFNNDKLIDFAFVIQTEQPLKFEDTECFSTQPFYPKILLVLKRQKDKSLLLTTTATKLFGNCNWGVEGQDPFNKLVLRKNTLGIIFLTGGTTRNWLSYYFRFQNEDWFLIGAESYQYWAGHTNDAEAYYNQKINFSTNFIEKYSEDPNHKQYNYKKEAIEKKALIKLTEFDDNSEIPFGEGM